MAKRNTKKSVKPETEPEVVKAPIIRKPYIDTITKDTKPRDVDVDKLPKSIKIKFLGDGTGMQSNRYLGKSGGFYDFNGGVPIEITNDKDRKSFVLKARKNPEVWEIVK